MKVLAIETSCDETAVAVVEGDGIQKQVGVLSNVVSSSLALHQKTGGIVPEVAAREQLTSIIPLVKSALEKSGLEFSKIDGVAVTRGPGLIGSLLVGVETAKVISDSMKIPLLPVNHLMSHLFSNWLEREAPLPSFPALGMIVSGGHTDLILLKTEKEFSWIGGTRDDAAGECFDKCARLILDAPYPGGPAISKYSKKTDDQQAKILPRPMIHEDSLEMSFSGLKTAVLHEVQNRSPLSEEDKISLSKDLENAIVEVLMVKLKKSLEKHTIKSVLVGGGVVANDLFRENLLNMSGELNVPVYFPDIKYCSDNAAMVGAAAIVGGVIEASADKVFADPSLKF